MLMFGPKNAPGTQVQYLYVPHDVSTEENLKLVRPKRGIILNITQFDGIPMADVFKVLQYWTFMSHPSDESKTIVKVGLAMHYIKSSLFKSQIFGGTRDELSDQLKKWFIFIVKRVADYQLRIANIEDYDPAEDEEADTISEEPDTIVMPAGLTLGVARRKSFEDAGMVAVPRPISRRVSGSSVNNLPAVNQAYSNSAQIAVHSEATAVPQSKDTNRALLLGVLIVFLVLILIQWSYNRSLARQITVLNAKFDLSQAQTEQAMKETHAMIERLLKHMNVK